MAAFTLDGKGSRVVLRKEEADVSFLFDIENRKLHDCTWDIRIFRCFSLLTIMIENPWKKVKSCLKEMLS